MSLGKIKNGRADANPTGKGKKEKNIQEVEEPRSFLRQRQGPEGRRRNH